MPKTEATEAAALAKALSHPLRIEILEDLGDGRTSPNQFSNGQDESLGAVSYHFKVLEKLGCLELVDTAQKRGALEHIYAITTQGKALRTMLASL
jgi:DNA-binding transcriptional ArsR family regulator